MYTRNFKFVIAISVTKSDIFFFSWHNFVFHKANGAWTWTIKHLAVLWFYQLSNHSPVHFRSLTLTVQNHTKSYKEYLHKPRWWWLCNPLAYLYAWKGLLVRSTTVLCSYWLLSESGFDSQAPGMQCTIFFSLQSIPTLKYFSHLSHRNGIYGTYYVYGRVIH